MRKLCGSDMERYTLNVLLEELKDKEVKIITSVEIDEITDEGLITAFNL